LIKKVAFKTLGCKVNQYETGALRQSFHKNGYQIVEFREKADLYIINTCAVTAEAERKSKQMIRKAARLSPQAIIIVTGCAVDSNLTDIGYCESLSFIVGNYHKGDIYNIVGKTPLNKEQPAVYIASPEKITEYRESKCNSATSRIRGLVKVQDGCNQFCSYCIIPYLRGRARSRHIERVLAEINTLADKDFKEVVLLGINLGSYGSDFTDKKMDLVSLLGKIESSGNIARVRLSSIELPYINEELIKVFSCSPKLCHHLHIPLQSGDDKILSLMNRKYSTKQYLKTIDLIKERVPDIAITTDVIVGFPGEDKLAFNNTINFVKKCGFSKIHVFPYSERKINLASFLPAKNDNDLIKSRCKTIVNLSKELHRSFIKGNIGKEKNILIESIRSEENRSIACGLTDNYIKTCLRNVKTGKGQIIKTRLTEGEEDYAIGKPV